MPFPRRQLRSVANSNRSRRRTRRFSSNLPPDVHLSCSWTQGSKCLFPTRSIQRQTKAANSLTAFDIIPLSEDDAIFSVLIKTAIPSDVPLALSLDPSIRLSDRPTNSQVRSSLKSLSVSPVRRECALIPIAAETFHLASLTPQPSSWQRLATMCGQR
jgi:hypothetical protein